MPVTTKQLIEPATMSSIVDKVSVQTEKSLPKSSPITIPSPNKGPVPTPTDYDIDPVQIEVNLLPPPQFSF